MLSGVVLLGLCLYFSTIFLTALFSVLASFTNQLYKVNAGSNWYNIFLAHSFGERMLLPINTEFITVSGRFNYCSQFSSIRVSLKLGTYYCHLCNKFATQRRGKNGYLGDNQNGREGRREEWESFGGLKCERRELKD